MDKKLIFEALLKFILGVAIVWIIIFFSAGSIKYLEGWLFMGVLFIPMLILGIILLIINPDLLRKRLKSKEIDKSQILVQSIGGLVFIIGFIIAGLDYRYSWLPMPWWMSIIGASIFMIAYLLYGEVLRENTFLSRTIEVQEGQKVIDTGLYGIVRHPMYLAAMILFLSFPIILGSIISFCIFLIYPILLGIRIVNEEKYLETNLEGYSEYKKKVKYRLIPFIW